MGMTSGGLGSASGEGWIGFELGWMRVEGGPNSE